MNLGKNNKKTRLKEGANQGAPTDRMNHREKPGSRMTNGDEWIQRKRVLRESIRYGKETDEEIMGIRNSS